MEPMCKKPCCAADADTADADAPLSPPPSPPPPFSPPSAPASPSTASTNTPGKMIKVVRALYADKQNFSYYEHLGKNKIFCDIASLRTQLGFAEDVPVIAAKEYEVTALTCDKSDHDKIIRTTSLLGALFKKALNRNFELEDLNKPPLEDEDGMPRKKDEEEERPVPHEDNYIGICEFIAIVLQKPLPASTTTADGDGGSSSSSSSSKAIVLDSAFVDSLTEDDILHVWYCILTWPFVFASFLVASMDRCHFIDDFATHLNLPDPEHLATYLATERCILWTDYVFSPFNGGWNPSTKEHEGPIASDTHQFAPIACHVKPLPDLSSAGALFRFTLLHSIVSDHFGPEGSNDGYMMFFVKKMLSIRNNINEECEERESIKQVVMFSWKVFRAAFPALPEDLDEVEDEGEKEEESQVMA